MSLPDRWKAFLTTVLDPLSVALMISTIFLSIVLLGQTDRILIATLTFLVSVFSGVLGGVLGKKWDDLTGERIIVARGKSAIRNLKLLLGAAVALERRVRRYLAQCAEDHQGEDRAPQAITIYLEEAVARCILLEEGILSSIESWTDIIPEADVKTQIGLISELTLSVDKLQQELSALSAELQETKGKSEDEIARLESGRRQKEKELSELRRELSERTLGMGLPLDSNPLRISVGPLPTGTTNYLTASGSESLFTAYQAPHRCGSCGKEYQDPLGQIRIGGLCPECQQKLTVGDRNLGSK